MQGKPILLPSTLGWQTLMTVLLGAAIGWLAWGTGRQPVVALLIPVLAVVLERTTLTIALFIGYMAVATRSILLGAFTFSILRGDALAGAAGWSAYVVGMGLLWGFAAGKPTAMLRRLLGLLLLEMALLLPPTWLLGIAHPVLGVGYLLGGAGWWGLAAGLTLPLAIGAVLKATAARDVGLTAVAVFLAVMSWTGEDPELRNTALTHGVVTRAGSTMETDMDAAARLPLLAAGLEAANAGFDGKDRVKLVVFPEAAIGVANESLPLLVRLEMQPVANHGNVSAFIGVDRAIDGRRQVSALVVQPNKPPAWIDARQPMPVALWHPWSEDSFEADWTRSSQVEVEGVGRVWVSFCFEDVLPGFVLSAILHKPDQIVSMANNWWSTEDGSQAQARSIESVARLFQIPLVRGVNLPMNSGAATSAPGVVAAR